MASVYLRHGLRPADHGAIPLYMKKRRISPLDFIQEIEKIGLSEEEYMDCLQDIIDKQNGDNDLDWEEIKDKYNLPITACSLRKANSKPFGGAFVKTYFESKQQNNAPATYIEQMNEIRKEKQKLSDERAALRKISRDEARCEANLEYLGRLIQEKEFPEMETYFSPTYDSENDLLICLHDFHYGLNIKNNFGEYNSDIAKERLDKYLQRILEIQEIHHSQNAFILLGGDLISGGIHTTVQLQNRENIVEQVQGASELISLFIYKLSKHFNHVYVNGTCGGNHSRVNPDKNSVLRNERLDLLVPWYIDARLGTIANVKIINDAIDPSIAMMTIRGNNYIGVHGDMDKLTENGINKLRAMINQPFKAVILGHLHHSTYDEISNIDVIRSGSFVDPIDDYSISKRISGHASQMVMVIDYDGIKSFYPVDLR